MTPAKTAAMRFRPALAILAVSSLGLLGAPALGEDRVVRPPVRETFRDDVVPGVVVSSLQYVPTPGVQDGYTAPWGGGEYPVGPDGYVTQPSSPLPVSMHLLEIDTRRFDGRIVPSLGHDVIAGRELLSETAKRRGAVAAVTGGFFVTGREFGLGGDPAGLSIHNGEVVSEAVNGRSALVWPTGPGTGGEVLSVFNGQSVTAPDGARLPLDGVNRFPGLTRMCGGVGDSPTSAPLHDRTCTDTDELVLFTPVWGAPVPDHVTAAVRLDKAGRVLGRHASGKPVRASERVLAATGSLAAWLNRKAVVRSVLDVDLQLVSERGLLDPTGLNATNGGPRLVTDGELDVRIVEEGFRHPDDALFEPGYTGLNPRCGVGITAKDVWLLACADGRGAGGSPGLSLVEFARFFAERGAVSAMNLDGGGSTTLWTAEHGVVNTPSDGMPSLDSDPLRGDERDIADGILLLPRR